MTRTRLRSFGEAASAQPRKKGRLMTRAEDKTLILPAEAFDGGAAGPWGDWRPVLVWETAAPFAILDDFDQSLRRSQRLLIESGGWFELWPAEGPVLRQPAEAEGFAARFAEGPVKAALKDLSPLRRLSRTGVGELRRGELALTEDSGEVRARAGLLLFSGTGEGLLAALPEGEGKALKALEEGLAALGAEPLRRGDPARRLHPELAPYQAKPEAPIDPDARAFDAASDIVAACLPVLRANEAGIVADLDTEHLHDHRVALRRIRSVLSLFKDVYDADQTGDLKARFSALMAPTGPLRDLDVYLLEREAFYAMAPEALHEGLDEMFELFARERAAEQARLAEFLRSPAWLEEMTALEALFRDREGLKPGPDADHGAWALACELIWGRYRKIRRTGAKLIHEAPDEEIHKLRIHCKKLRYLMEFFAPLFPAKPFADLLKPLKTLQEALGVFNDASVQQASLRRFVEGLEAKGAHHGGLGVALSVGALISVLHHRQLAERSRIAESFVRFASRETQNAFRELFHEKKRRRRAS